MTTEPEEVDGEEAEDIEEPGEPYPDVLSGPDGQAYFGTDVQTFLAHWLEKLGFGTDGAAVIFGEGCSLAIIHPESGEALTPLDIAKRVHRPANLRRMQ